MNNIEIYKNLYKRGMEIADLFKFERTLIELREDRIMIFEDVAYNNLIVVIPFEDIDKDDDFIIEKYKDKLVV